MYIPLRIDWTKTKRHNFYKNTTYITWYEKTNEPQLYNYTCPIYTNKQQKTLQAKLKHEKEIAKESIRKD